MKVFSPKPKLGMRTRVVLGCTFISVFISALATGSFYLNFRSTVFEGYQQKLLDIVSFAAIVQNGDDHSKISHSSSYYGPLWNSLNSLNNSIVYIDPDILFIYTLKKDAQGQIYYVLDSGKNTVDPLQPYVSQNAGTILADPTLLLSTRFDSITGPLVEETITLANERNNYASGVLSAYAPFYRTDGSIEGIIGVDISAGPILAAYRRAQLNAIIIFLVSIPFSILLGFVIGNSILKPFRKLVDGAKVIASGNLNYQINVQSNDETKELASTINEMTSQLGALVSGLNQKLSDRSLELEEAADRSGRRARQFEALSQVARGIASLENLETLLKKTTELISDNFKYYHVGIFLCDEDREYVILRSTNSEGGQKMLLRGHQLKIGEEGIVGNVAASGQPRIALDTSIDTVFYKNPNLPETRSEMALPLRVGNQLTGVLDVQSKEPNAFSKDDIELLTTLADQVSIAIENVRLFETAQRSLAEAELAYRDYIKKEWTKLSREKTPIGFSYSPRGTRALDVPLTIKTTASEDGRIKQLQIPIKIRSETIGLINVSVPAGKDLTQDQISLVQAVADRLSLSAENARLFEETTRRAERERTVSEVTTRIRGSTDPQQMLRTAIEELQRILGANDIKIRPYATLRSSSTKSPDDANSSANSTTEEN